MDFCDSIINNNDFNKFNMKQNINIEAEGSELILRNSAGDHVIIPKKYRTEVQGMIKDGCHGCIDSLVETLPVMADYAEDGSLLPSWSKVKATINPYNWGVTDYSDKGDFKTAYAAAKKAGEKEFMWNNERKAVIDKNLPGERITQRDDFSGNIFTNIATDEGWRYNKGAIADLYRYYGGVPLKTNKLSISKYKPTNSKENIKYISINDDELINEVLNQYKRIFIDNNLQKELKSGRYTYPGDIKINDYTYAVNGYRGSIDFATKYANANIDKKTEILKNKPITGGIGGYFVSHGKDDRGEYVSYWDKFDRDTGNQMKGFDLGGTKPFEIYDRIYVKDYGDGQKKRMYYSDKELSELNLDKKDFDTLALQRELSNRGYKLPKSTKQSGSFDGIWGDETKAALLDYQIKNRKK